MRVSDKERRRQERKSCLQLEDVYMASGKYAPSIQIPHKQHLWANIYMVFYLFYLIVKSYIYSFYNYWLISLKCLDKVHRRGEKGGLSAH